MTEQQPKKLNRREKLEAQIEEQIKANTIVAQHLAANQIEPGMEVIIGAQIAAIIKTLCPPGTTDHLQLLLHFHQSMWEMFFSHADQIKADVAQQRLVEGVSVKGNGQPAKLIMPPGFMG